MPWVHNVLYPTPLQIQSHISLQKIKRVILLFSGLLTTKYSSYQPYSQAPGKFQSTAFKTQRCFLPSYICPCKVGILNHNNHEKMNKQTI